MIEFNVSYFFIEKSSIFTDIYWQEQNQILYLDLYQLKSY